MKNFVKDKNIELDISLIEDNLIICLNYPAQAMGQSERKKIPIDHISTICFEMIETLNADTRNNNEKKITYERLVTYGKKFSNILFNADRIKTIFNTKAKYILIKLDEQLVHIPWELMYLENAFLCEHFHIGRKIKTNRKIPPHQDKQLNNPLNMLIVANPESNLMSASIEGLEICEIADALHETVSAKLDGETTYEEISSSIKFFDIFHFAGHAEYDQNYAEKCGLKLTDSILSASKIEGLSKLTQNAMPCLVFSNACQSARTLKQDLENVTSSPPFNLASAFIFAGVNHYIGTFWEILDEPSSDFALEFYRQFFSGKTIGESVTLARNQLKEKYGHHSIGWASYLIYGDPSISYFDKDEPVSKIVHSSSEINCDTPKNGNETNSPLSSKDSITRGTGLKKLSSKQFICLAASIFLCLCFIIFTKYFQNQYNNKIVDYICQNEQKKIVEINKLLDELFQYREKQFTPIIDEWTSKPLTIIIDVDSATSKLNQQRERLILNAIGKEIIEKTSFQQLERNNLVVILREKKFANINNPLISNLKTAHFFLFFSVEQETALFNFWHKTIIIRLTNDQGLVLFSDFQTISSMKQIADQVPGLMSNLIHQLMHIKQKTKLRGKILDIITDHNVDVKINIGENCGVRLDNQFFIVEKPSIILQVYKTGSNESFLKSSDKNVTIQKGWRVERSKRS
jgi:CHAT domain-containing protein